MNHQHQDGEGEQGRASGVHKPHRGPLATHPRGGTKLLAAPSAARAPQPPVSSAAHGHVEHPPLIHVSLETQQPQEPAQQPRHVDLSTIEIRAPLSVPQTLHTPHAAGKDHTAHNQHHGHQAQEQQQQQTVLQQHPLLLPTSPRSQPQPQAHHMQPSPQDQHEQASHDPDGQGHSDPHRVQLHQHHPAEAQGHQHAQLAAHKQQQDHHHLQQQQQQQRQQQQQQQQQQMISSLVTQPVVGKRRASQATGDEQSHGVSHQHGHALHSQAIMDDSSTPPAKQPKHSSTSPTTATSAAATTHLSTSASPPSALAALSNPTKKAKLLEAEAALADIKRLRRPGANPLTAAESLVILHTTHFLKMEQISSPNRIQVRERTSDLLGYSSSTIAKVLAAWHKDRSVYTPAPKGNRSQKETRISREPSVTNAIRDFVRQSRASKQRVTATQVLEMLKASKLLVIPGEDATPERGSMRPGLAGSSANGLKASSRGEAQVHGAIGDTMISTSTITKNTKSAIRCVQRHLIRLGYERGSFSSNLELTKEARETRSRYLWHLLKNRHSPQEQRRREVYIDETQVPILAGDPDDPSKPLHASGLRLCIAAAMLGHQPVLQTEGATGADRARLLEDSLWIFTAPDSISSSSSNNSNSSSTPALHAPDPLAAPRPFTGDKFLAWLSAQVLDKLSSPSLILLDTARYHTVSGAHEVQVGSLSTDALCEELKARGIVFEPGEPQAMLQFLLHQSIEEARRPRVVALAEEKGHAVLFLPPKHSDLQPLHLIWSHVRSSTSPPLQSKELDGGVVKALQELVHDEGRFRDDGKTICEAALDQVDEVIAEYLQHEHNDGPKVKGEDNDGVEEGVE